MAGTSAYKLLLEAQLDPSKIQADIKALSSKTIFNVNLEFKNNDLKKLESEVERIKDKASSISKITAVGDTKGGINRALIEYKDQVGNVVKEWVKVNEQAGVNQTYVQNLERDEKTINSIIEKRAALNAKQTDEMHKAALEAEKFIAKSQNLAQTPSVTKAVAKAEEIKVAVNEGDITKVRKLNDEFSVLKASLQTGRTGLDSWTEGMRNAIKQTMEYALSIGLVYGALNQLRQGIQYVSELNKEMTNIQLLQVEGARTDEQVKGLAESYNGLAKEVGATTLEVAQGSVEWLYV